MRVKISIAWKIGGDVLEPVDGARSTRFKSGGTDAVTRKTGAMNPTGHDLFHLCITHQYGSFNFSLFLSSSCSESGCSESGCSESGCSQECRGQNR